MTPIAYGEGMNMAMEQLDMESMGQDTCLVQDRCGSDLMTTGQVFLVPGSSICRGQVRITQSLLAYYQYKSCNFIRMQFIYEQSKCQ